jgi:hypothetical protein
MLWGQGGIECQNAALSTVGWRFIIADRSVRSQLVERGRTSGRLLLTVVSRLKLSHSTKNIFKDLLAHRRQRRHSTRQIEHVQHLLPIYSRYSTSLTMYHSFDTPFFSPHDRTRILHYRPTCSSFLFQSKCVA